VTGVSEFNGEEITSFFQVSRGIKVEYNPENNNGSRLVSVTIGGEPLDRATDYNVVTLDFIAGGGDNFFANPFDNVITLDTQDEILTQYIQSKSPVDIELDGRIAIVSGSASTAGGNGTSGGNGNNSTTFGAGNGTVPGDCPANTACTPPIFEGGATQGAFIPNAIAACFLVCLFAIL
jgi:5'-nucleotidase